MQFPEELQHGIDITGTKYDPRLNEVQFPEELQLEIEAFEYVGDKPQ